jgi:hypothetical protein
VLAWSDEWKRSGHFTNGAFEISSVLPGRYWVDVQVASDQYVESARAGDTDLLETPELVVGWDGAPDIEVIVRTDAGFVSGTIAPTAAAGGNEWLLLVPESCKRPAKTAWLSAGEFRFTGVAPGNYRVHAWRSGVEVEWGSPGRLCALARGGLPVEVKADRETKVQVQNLSEGTR